MVHPILFINIKKSTAKAAHPYKYYKIVTKVFQQKEGNKMESGGLLDIDNTNIRSLPSCP
jgi:hypothetical protein